MKSAGMSAHQVLAPLFLAAFLVAGVSFVFNERIVVRSNAALTEWTRAGYAQLPPETGVRNNIWVRAGDDLINAGEVRRIGKDVILKDVKVYERKDGVIASLLTADQAKALDDGWQLENATRFDRATNDVTELGNIIAGRGVKRDQFTLSNVNGDAVPFWQLKDVIDELDAAGRPVDGLRAIWWHKISGPLSAILMPLLGAVAAFGLARSGKLYIRAIIGMGLGFAYFVADNFALAMGDLGAYSPFMAAWGPFMLFFLIGEMILIRTEE
jgi:lipopolysaccharide export system permease protein